MTARLLLAHLGAAVVAIMLSHLSAPPRAMAQQRDPIDPAQLGGFTWRHIGPDLSGRVTAAAGSAGRPGVFFVGASGGGVWRTTDYGQHWQPVFDAPPVGLVHAIAVAESNPNVVYVGAGGFYRSLDGGRTFAPASLGGGRPVTRIAVDPANADHLLVAIADGPSVDAGVAELHQSRNGGLTFQRVAAPGVARPVAIDVAFDPSAPSVMYAAFASAADADASTASSVVILKSIDNGVSWRRLNGDFPVTTSPAAESGPVSIAVSRAQPGRVYLLVPSPTDGTLYRSDDGGGTWRAVNTGSTSDASRRTATNVVADSAEANIAYLTGASLRRSTDGGVSFAPWPTSRPPRAVTTVWMHPTNRDVMLLGNDEGASVSVNGGQTWSSPVSLPAADIRRVSTDAAFPYRACVLVASHGVRCGSARADAGAGSAHNWVAFPSAGDAPVLPDPLDADVFFTSNLIRFDRRTGQALPVSPVLGDALRSAADEPAVLAFSPDGRSLFAGLRSVWRTANHGQTWTEISPNLTGTDGGRPATLRISALVVSAIDGRTVWAGTSNGLVHLTRDAGVVWTNVTPPSLPAGAQVVSLEPSRFDASSVYIVVTLQDGAPRLLRTRDSGATWADLERGFPPSVAVRAVREDAFRRGLLFAATDQSVYFSIDDGDRWQSLRLNLPASPVRDVVIKDADLVIATGGRGVWVLEDFSPLRQLTSDVARSDAFLFRPAQTWRVRGTPDEPGRTAVEATAAPEGVALSYIVGSTLVGPLTLEIIETVTGDVLRRYTSEASGRQPGDALLARTPGLHRVIWDLRYTRPEQDSRAPAGARVLPGTYQVRLTTSTRAIRQAIAIRMDPRVRVAPADLAAERTLTRALHARRAEVASALETIGERLATEGGEARTRLAASMRALTDNRDELRRITRVVNGADARPSAAVEAAAADALARAAAALVQWREQSASQASGRN